MRAGEELRVQMPTDVGKTAQSDSGLGPGLWPGLFGEAFHGVGTGNLSNTSLNQEGLRDPALDSRATEAENNCTGGKHGGECQENGGGRDVVCHGGDDPEKN
jgi:hypothetical protein